MPQFGQITPAQAMRLIGTPDAPTVFDVRLPEDLDALPRLVPTSRVIPHDAVDSLTDPPGRAIVVCSGAASFPKAPPPPAQRRAGRPRCWRAAARPGTRLACR